MYMVKKVLKEHQPWNLSYKRSLKAHSKTSFSSFAYKISHDARPSWSRHGMPALYSSFIKLLGKNHTNGGFHLDIGCGNGVKTVNYALIGFKTVGVDISDDGFHEARELIRELGISKKCKVIQASCLKLPFEDNSAASASDTLCFTHVKPKDQKRYKEELYRVLKPGGYTLLVFFSDKDKHFHGHKVSKRYTFRFDPTNELMEGYSHYHGMFNYHFGKAEVKKTFGDIFEIIEMKEVGHPLYSHRFLWNVILRKSQDESQNN